MPDFAIPLDIGNPMETLGAPLALVILILMGNRFSRAHTGESGGFWGMFLIALIVAAGFFWAYQMVCIIDGI